MRSNLDELLQELGDLRTLVDSLVPVNAALAGHQDNLVRQYLTIRRRFDYAAFIVGLYASFEKFVENVVVAYAHQITARTQYGALPKKLVVKHMLKSAELLAKGRLGEGRYAAIREVDVVKNLHECLSGATPYALNTIAVAAHDTNLRCNEITALFAAVGIEHVCQRALRADALLAWFCTANGLDAPPEAVPSPAVEPRIENLVDRRNQVAHRGGGPDDLLGPVEMKELLEFIEAFARSIFAITAASYLRMRHVDSGEATLLTLREGPYKDGTVVVVDKPSEQVARNQPAFVLTENAGARWGRILDLQLDGSSVAVVDDSTAGPDVGILLDFECPKVPGIFVLAGDDDVVWPPMAPSPALAVEAVPAPDIVAAAPAAQGQDNEV